MTTRAAAIIADAHREVLDDPLARYKRRKVRELRADLSAYVWMLFGHDFTFDRNGRGAITLQIDRLEAEIYASGPKPA